ncbi:MAG: DUF5666 domain-containing protein [candidate division KSB1 bacterium]|nr:DUF5666 domain-containing protein [candidate division KSB1 bacterium]MDZ7273227.1 DUF5666 domain-containing protein [candidate division KSB1 bacterium]MDZ7285329.1 DUF5666 domain-containing protein [candidate division KSB1 bacterium]MDZ7298361.1 DUF5666 domain-containing protein [candidate division KSB1 bacterium]MDZ7308525.1 DUF5666 domain-containing protein [candidate division KSB1 bacterium]
MRMTLTMSAALLAGAVLVSVATSRAQGTASAPNKARQQVDIFATAKMGQWIEIKGAPQKDNIFVATKVKFLTGDLLDDEWEVSGKILSIDAAKREIRLVRHWPIRCEKETEFEDGNGNPISFEKLYVGMLVEAEGTFLKDGTFLAKEIEEEELKEPEEANHISLLGKVEKVNPDSKAIQVMGTTFLINDQTKSKSAIK